MFNPKDLFHVLDFNADVKPPQKFTYPFNYKPHPWVEQAADKVKTYLESQSDFDYEFGWDDTSVGKMFGILIVEDESGRLGYLAAFSGKIGEVNELPGFVPPIFDVLNPEGFFKVGENQLNLLNQKILELQTSTEFIELKNNVKNTVQQQKESLKMLKVLNKNAKRERDLKRKEISTSENQKDYSEFLDQLIQESKRHHFEFKDQRKNWQEKVQIAEDELNNFQRKIDYIRLKRKQKSADLQTKIHEAYQLLNANGKIKPLLPIFESFNRMPPAGAGECAAPRLLQFAYKNKMNPIALGEFWWGKPPNSEIRKHGEFYPACKSKCEPILTYMLQGLEVDKNPILEQVDYLLDVVYEDEWLLLVNKPAGILSVPGKEIKTCIAQKVAEYLSPDLSPLLVHRLDMATSGLVLVAKSLNIYKNLQIQFTERTVNKIYTAILDGEILKKRGKIEFPIRVDLDNRPMQLVCEEHGKNAITHYQVKEVTPLGTRILFYPITGRTHQLRVHAAHQRGLGVPIRGDDLYGKSGDRLYLHATTLEFTHPITNKRLKIVSKPSF